MNKATTNITCNLEIVTPAIAEEWLRRNTKNRNKKKLRISRYARDMEHGRWKITHHGIAFDQDGRLIDGQNRLYAVIESETPIHTFVFRGLDTETQLVMDSGAARTAADSLDMTGRAASKDLATTAAVHKAWNEGEFDTAVSSLTGANRMSNLEIVEYIDAHPELVSAVEHVSKYRPVLRGLSIGSIAVAFDEFSRIDFADAVEFFERIKDMRFEGKGDPFLTLRRRIDAEAGKTTRILQSTALFFLFRTWNAVRDGENFSRILLGSEERGWAQIPTPR